MESKNIFDIEIEKRSQTLNVTKGISLPYRYNIKIICDATNDKAVENIQIKQRADHKAFIFSI